jgi:hypothetical protein
MTCQECELRLADDQIADEHLLECENCRALAGDLRLNAAAFESFAADPLPSVSAQVMSRVRVRRAVRWTWALAAAAMLAIVIFVAHRGPVQPTEASIPATQQPIRERQRPGPVTIANKPVAKRRSTNKGAPLMVKMLTDDPDVVIYWQFESEEENQ